MIVVSDSSPLISVAAIGRLELFQSIFSSLVIPQAVYDEIVAGKDRPGAQEISKVGWIQVTAVRNQHAVRRLMSSAHLHTGESEAIVLAGELKATHLILDDRAARKAAQRKRIPVMGTLGVLLLAKDLKLISAVEPCLRELLAAGKYVDPDIYRHILLKAREL